MLPSGWAFMLCGLDGRIILFLSLFIFLFNPKGKFFKKS